MVLYGRDDEIAFLRDRLSEVGAGAVSLVTIQGPAGIGKSALLDLLKDDAEARGHKVLQAVAGPECSEIPFLPIANAFERELEESQRRPELLRGLARDLEPLLVTRTGALSVSRHGSGPQAALANDAACRFIRRLARIDPLVLIVEDVHWADRSTLRLLRWLMRQLRDAPVLLALSFRNETVSPELAALAALGRTLPLGPVDDLSARRILAASVLEVAAPNLETSTSAVELAGGNPLFLKQAARAIEEGVALSTLREGLAAVLRARLSALSPGQRDQICAAAVLGAEFAPEAVARLLGLPVGETLAALQAAADADFLEPGGAGGSMKFVHSLAREAAASSRMPAERARLHGLVLAMKASWPSPPPDGELALHAEQAGDYEECAKYASRAAAEAMKRAAFHEAAAHFDLVLATSEKLGELPPLDILESAARTWLASGRAARASSAYLELGERYSAEGDSLAAAEAIAHAARASANPMAVELLRNVIDDIEPLGTTPALAQAWATWAHLQAGGRSTGGKDVVNATERALGLARESGSSRALATALLARGHIVANAFDFAQGCVLLRECLEVASACGEQREEHAAAVNLVSLLTKACRWQEAESHARTSAEEALRRGAYRQAGQLFARLSDVQQLTGRWQVARRSAEDAVILTDSDDPQAERAARFALATCAVLKGGWAEAEGLIAGALQGESWTFFPHAPWLVLQTQVRMGAGDEPAALASARSTHRLWLQSRDAFYGIQYCESFSRLLCNAGAVVEADEVLSECARRLNWMPAEMRRLPIASIGLQQGFVARAHGDHVGALALFASARADFERLGIPLKVGRAALEYAVTAVALNDHDLRRAAREAATTAQTQFEALGSPELEKTQRLIHRMRWARTHVSPSGTFTEREEEIAALVSEGLSNTEIADQLIVSVRTVENHLARMFVKLGVRSRTALVHASKTRRVN